MLKPKCSGCISAKIGNRGYLDPGGGPPNAAGAEYLYRMAPGSFSSAALTAIPVPTPSAGNAPSVRSITEDGSDIMWFVNTAGGQYMSIPAAGPYVQGSIVTYQLPGGIAGTPNLPGHARTIDYAGGVLVASDNDNGLVDVINPDNGVVTGQYLSNLQTSYGTNGGFDSANAYDSATDGSKVYITNTAGWNTTIPVGDLEAFDPTTNTFATMPIVAGPVGVQPTVPSVNGSYLGDADYFLSGIDFSNATAGTARFVPLLAQGISFFEGPRRARNDE